MPREGRDAKAIRLIVEQRVRLTLATPTAATAEVRGDEADYTVKLAGRWSCTCPAPGECSHIGAVRTIYRAVRPALEE